MQKSWKVFKGWSIWARSDQGDILFCQFDIVQYLFLRRSKPVHLVGVGSDSYSSRVRKLSELLVGYFSADYRAKYKGDWGKVFCFKNNIDRLLVASSASSSEDRVSFYVRNCLFVRVFYESILITTMKFSS